MAVSSAVMKLGGRERVDDEAALEELFARLPVTPNWTMGFLAALGSGPDTVPSATWIPAIVGAASFDAATGTLLERLFGAAAETLRTTPDVMPPEPDKPAEDVVEFARGYIQGTSMHTGWQTDVAAKMLLGPFEEIVHADADVAALRGMLGDAVRTTYIHWRSKRQVIGAPKVGRNDPCPCGSGKKHKKCCLAA